MAECEHGACGDCNPTGYQMEKLDAWHAAFNAIKDADWDTEAYTPRDVLMLALFLTGAELNVEI